MQKTSPSLGPPLLPSFAVSYLSCAPLLPLILRCASSAGFGALRSLSTHSHPPQQTRLVPSLVISLQQRASSTDLSFSPNFSFFQVPSLCVSLSLFPFHYSNSQLLIPIYAFFTFFILILFLNKQNLNFVFVFGGDLLDLRVQWLN